MGHRMKIIFFLATIIILLVISLATHAQKDTSRSNITIYYPEEFIDTLLPNKKYTFNYFLSDDTAMTAIMKDFCRQASGYLKSCTACKLLVQTHSEAKKTDSIAYIFSDGRLHVILNYLKDFGIDTSRIFYSSMGSLMPLRPNADAKSRARNRRVDFKIIKPQSH